MGNYVLCVFLSVSVLPALVTTSNLAFSCFPNGTFVVTNPNATVFTHVMAFEDLGTSFASPCNVSVSGSLVEITECQMDHPITVHFSDRMANASRLVLFGGRVLQTYRIECQQIGESIDRTVTVTFHVHTTTAVQSESTATEAPTLATTVPAPITTVPALATTAPAVTYLPVTNEPHRIQVEKRPLAKLLMQLLEIGPQLLKERLNN